MKKIVIIGTGRTASKLYREVFNRVPNVYILHEVMFDFRMKIDIDSLLRKHKAYSNTNNIHKAFDDIFSFSFFRNFKSEYKNPETLINNLTASDNITWGNALNTIIETRPYEQGYKIAGAKNPVHFSYAPKMIKELEDIKVIFLARDPRALYASELPMKTKSSQLSQFPRIKNRWLQRILIFSYTNLEWIWSMLIYNRLKNKLILCKYEDLVTNSEFLFKRVFDFCEIPYKQEYIENIGVIGSSHIRNNNKGFSDHALDRWKNYLNRFEKIWFKILISIFKY